METPRSPTSVARRVREGLSRIAVAMRSDEWRRTRATGLNPTQLAILELVEARRAGIGVKAIAAELGVSQPTATDSINALERKGLLAKAGAAADRRAVVVASTPAGLAMLAADAAGASVAERAVEALDGDEQAAMLLALVRMIRHLQEAGAIPIQRMCATCRHFAPFAHPDAARPHHCHLVDAAFGQRDLRIDCREHETADPAARAATWEAFRTGSASPLQATDG